MPLNLETYAVKMTRVTKFKKTLAEIADHHQKKKGEGKVRILVVSHSGFGTKFHG